MTDPSETVVLARQLEALIPTFLANRRKELDALRSALAEADFTELQRIGHCMKGVGASYGFARISACGVQVEQGARALDRAAIAACIDDYAEYLGKLRIAYD